MSEINEILDELSRKALENLANDGALVPVAVLFPRVKEIPATIIPLQWGSEEEKAEVIALVRGLARATAAAIVYILETWISRKPKPDVRPSEDPDREEAVVLAAFTPHSSRLVVIPFRRDDSGRPVPLQPEDHSGDISSSMDPWPDRVAPS